MRGFVRRYGRRRLIKRYSEFLIQLDEERIINPDNRDLMEDTADWALDLARLFVSRDKDAELREEIRKEHENNE